jgi:hypothetical protein
MLTKALPEPKKISEIGLGERNKAKVTCIYH